MNGSLAEKIKALSTEYFDEIKNCRHHLHQHPELSFREFETSAFIQKKLNEYGIPFKNNIAETGVVALIEGNSPSSKTIALRADILEALLACRTCLAILLDRLGCGERVTYAAAFAAGHEVLRIGDHRRQIAVQCATIVGHRRIIEVGR